MQNLGKQQIFGHKNKNAPFNLNEVKRYSDLYQAAERHFESYKDDRAKKDEAIVEDYWAKKEELEHLYKMRDSDKKWELIKSKKAELDRLYNKYTCIRRAVWEKRQSRKQTLRNAQLERISLDLCNISGRTMNQRECDEFLASVQEHIPLTRVMTNDGGWVLGFEYNGLSYYPVKVKNGYRWEVSL